MKNRWFAYRVTGDWRAFFTRMNTNTSTPVSRLKYPDRRLQFGILTFGIVNLALLFLLGLIYAWGLWQSETVDIGTVLTIHGLAGVVGTVAGGMGYYLK